VVPTERALPERGTAPACFKTAFGAQQGGGKEDAVHYREVRDTMGTMAVPAEAYYGAQTQRAVENFAFSGLRLPGTFIHSLAMIKKGAAVVNGRLGLLEASPAAAIRRACDEVMAGTFDDQFVVDVFQTGSGTSTHMNMNEVLACRANELLTGEKRDRSPVHPNDHVNLGQSSNDVIPSALHVSAWRQVDDRLLPALEMLGRSLSEKGREFAGLRKVGRTHLQDAVPMTLGDEFSAHARQVELGVQRVRAVFPRLAELALGGTAVGTGINSHPRFAAGVIDLLNRWTGLAFVRAGNSFEAVACRDAVVEASAAVRTVAVSLTKIANDVRWLASGPRCGIGEIEIPALQPGSSIMPGKVNPVIPEAVLQATVQVAANDAAVAQAGMSGNFELNVMMPLMAYNLLQSIALTAAAAEHLAAKCIAGIRANAAVCTGNVDKSLALATLLVPRLGYERAAEVARKAHRAGKTIGQVLAEEGLMREEELKKLF